MEVNKLKYYIEKICEWSDEKGLTEHGIMDAQFDKIHEEIMELREAMDENDILKIKDAIGDIFVTLIVAKQMELKDYEKIQRGIYYYILDKITHHTPKDIMYFLLKDFEKLDFIRNKGTYVSTKLVNSMIGTLFLASKTYGMDLIDCIDHAYQIISKRTGKIINGSFVKDGN